MTRNNNTRSLSYLGREVPPRDNNSTKLSQEMNYRYFNTLHLDKEKYTKNIVHNYPEYYHKIILDPLYKKRILNDPIFREPLLRDPFLLSKNIKIVKNNNPDIDTQIRMSIEREKFYLKHIEEERRFRANLEKRKNEILIQK